MLPNTDCVLLGSKQSFYFLLFFRDETAKRGRIRRDFKYFQSIHSIGDLSQYPPGTTNHHLEALDISLLRRLQLLTKMPKSLAGFVNHPVYALKGQLKKDEILVSSCVPVGTFRGESVYAREDVQKMKTPDRWIREGRKVRDDAVPVSEVRRVKRLRNPKSLPTIELDQTIQYSTPLYTYDQTQALTEEAYNDYLSASGKYLVIKNVSLRVCLSKSSIRRCRQHYHGRKCI